MIVVLGGCGPAVETGGADSSSDPTADSAETAEDSADAGDTAEPTVTASDGVDTDDPGPQDVATGIPEPEPDPSADLSGEYLLAVSVVIAPETPFQWRATVDHTTASVVTMSLQPLTLDVLSTTSPREPYGDPLRLEFQLADDGTFAFYLGELQLAGVTNPITGSDLVADVGFDGQALGPEAFCGDAVGTVTSPLTLDLAGSTFAFTPIVDELPNPVVSRCP